MKKYSCIILCAFIVACGSNEFESEIKRNLKDPNSAQFRSQTINDDLGLACVEWNAKNTLGGYGAWTVALFQKKEGKWVALDIEASRQFNCDESYLRTTHKNFALEARGKAAREAAEAEAIQLLGQARNISEAEARQMAEKDEDCQKLVKSYAYNAGALVSDGLAETAKKFAAAGVKIKDDEFGRALTRALSRNREYESKLVKEREQLKAGVCRES